MLTDLYMHGMKIHEVSQGVGTSNMKNTTITRKETFNCRDQRLSKKKPTVTLNLYIAE